ncbi:MAG TPA: ABC transporter substrate-binding protein [Desulfocapsa sulfexigens]|nr:ABC transporter substrate-binding protein [Desulfocapsa sulfexigens]
MILRLPRSLTAVFITLLLVLYCYNAQAKEYPERIVSLGPINTENVFLLGAGDRLVANTHYCVRPEAAKTIEKIGSVMQISIEKIIGLQPDLVLATGLTQMRQLKQLESVGIKVVQFKQPASFADICTQFLQLGQLLGLEQTANEIINKTKNKVVILQKKVSHLLKQKVFLQVGLQPMFSSVASSFTNDFIVLAGGSNIASKQKNGIINNEKVIAANPDVIIIAIMGSESGIAAKEKERWMQIPVINAVQNNRVHVISPDIACSPSPATFAETLAIMADMIHPELNP